MMYLSKGSALSPKAGGLFQVSRCGKVYALGARLEALWRDGRRIPQEVPSGQERAITRLEASGLVSTTEESGALGAYRLVISCVLCPSYQTALRLPLRGRDRRVWDWITQSGLRLTASELRRPGRIRTPMRKSRPRSSSWMRSSIAVGADRRARIPPEVPPESLVRSRPPKSRARNLHRRPMARCPITLPDLTALAAVETRSSKQRITMKYERKKRT